MKALALAVCSLLVGCAAAQSSNQQIVQPQEQSTSSFTKFLRALTGPGPGLAAHDPPPGQQLFEQIPNWDGAAQKICCSALTRDQWFQSRCDTDRPIAPRSNRC